jgi:hypothetical protein
MPLNLRKTNPMIGFTPYFVRLLKIVRIYKSELNCFWMNERMKKNLYSMNLADMNDTADCLVLCSDLFEPKRSVSSILRMRPFFSSAYLNEMKGIV